jgi:ankyrin repeat protein
MGELFNAIYGGRRDEALSLIRSGRGLNAANEYGTTPLYAAAVQGEAEIVRCLLEHGADPNAESFGETEGTPLCAAAAWGTRTQCALSWSTERIQIATKGSWVMLP